MNRLTNHLTRRRVITPPAAIPNQRGMATLLIVLLVGVGLVSISVGAMHAIRSTQERQNAAHAQINSQSGAWAAAEAMRQYLLTLDATAVAALPLNTDWKLSGYTGFEPTVRFTAITGPHLPLNSYRVNTRITVIATAAQASSVLELVYEVSPATGSVTTPSNGAINYNGDTTLTAGITIYKDAGDATPYEINVIGNVSFSNISILGADIVRSTKSITVSGGTTPLKKLQANCDIYIDRASMPKNIQATRHVFVENPNDQGYGTTSCTNEEVRANGSISLTTSADCPYTDVFALAGKGGFSYCENPTANAAGLAAVKNQITTRFGTAAENPTNIAVAGGVYTNSTVKSELIMSNNDIIIQGTNTMGQLHAERDIEFKGGANTLSGFARYGRNLITDIIGTYNGLFEVDNSSGKDQKAAGTYNLSLEPVTSVNLTAEKIDVNDLKNYANYIFSVDSGGNKRVVIKDVNNALGAPLDYSAPAIDGKGYYILSGGGNTDWACKTVTAAVPADCTVKIGLGYSASNTLISYSGGLWDLSGTSLAPGIAFFDGNLKVNIGTYYNTFLATGNINTGDNAKIYAPNYAGFDGKQEKDGVNKTYAPQGICQNTIFPNLIPTQFCTATEYDFAATDGTGNYALIAGSYLGGSTYSGGNITSGSSGDIYGSVKAGNLYKSGGTTKVHGYISALGQQAQTQPHQLNSELIVDLRELPPGFNPMGNPTTPGTTTPGTASSAKILWSRYL